MNIQTELQHILKTALQQLDLTVPEDIHLEHPADDSHGDYSTNIAMKLFTTEGKAKGFTNPRDFAQTIIDQISELRYPISELEVAGPGFINITLSTEYLLKTVSQVDENFGSINHFDHKKIMVEFTDPNPFKEFHIGHLYSNTVGESISRLLENAGADVRRVCYQGDVGMHVAKSLWGCIFLTQQLESSFQFSLEPSFFESALNQLQTNLDQETIATKVKFLGQAYAKGASIYEEDEVAKQQMKDLNKLIFNSDAAIMPLYDLTKAWSLDYFDLVYKRLGTTFEKLYFESQVAPTGVEIVKKHLQDGTFEESKGAIIFPGSKYGLHDRVFINSLGLPTYEAKELGLAPTKYNDWPYDYSIILTGNEISEYFKVLLKALSIVNPTLAAKTTHLSHGMVRLPEGKMSSRTGKILTGEWLLEEAKKNITAIMANSKSGLSASEVEIVSEQVAVAAIKWALLRQSIGGNISFSLDESISFEGNSGPYIQYTFARTQSILKKNVESRELKVDQDPHSTLHTLQPNSSELKVLRLIYQFPEVIESAATEYAPHQVATYLFELAQRFNGFYANESVLDAQTDESKAFRLQLTQAVGTILKNGLHVLGIQAPSKM